jgi:hypothetical protein
MYLNVYIYIHIHMHIYAQMYVCMIDTSIHVNECKWNCLQNFVNANKIIYGFLWIYVTPMYMLIRIIHHHYVYI